MGFESYAKGERGPAETFRVGDIAEWQSLSTLFRALERDIPKLYSIERVYEDEFGRQVIFGRERLGKNALGELQELSPLNLKKVSIQ